MKLVRQICMWVVAFTVIALVAPSYAQPSSPPPLKSNEVIVKSRDGCGFVVDNSGPFAAYTSEAFSKLTWGGPCIDGLAMGEGWISEGSFRYSPGILPTRGWVWYGRKFGAVETHSENGSNPNKFFWDGKYASYNTLSTTKPVWGKQRDEESRVSDGNTSVSTSSKGCILDAQTFPECKQENKFEIPYVRVKNLQTYKNEDYNCPDPRSPQGCEALWAQHAGPVIERIKAFVAENEPKAEARKREIAPLIASWRPSPQAKQNDAARHAAQRAAQLAERAKDAAELDKMHRETEKLRQENAAAAKKAEEDRARDRRETFSLLGKAAAAAAGGTNAAERRLLALNALAGNEPSAVGSNSGALGASGSSSSGEAPKQESSQQRNSTASGGGPSPQQIAACSEDIKRKQIESQSWGGDANAVANRLGRYQKDLFEGRCAGHPEARTYVAGANKMLNYGGNATGSGGTSGGSQANIEIQGSPQCAKYYIVSETQETRTSAKMFSFGIQNICNFPVYIHWNGYFNDVETQSIDYSIQLKRGTNSRPVFGPGDKIEAIPFRIATQRRFYVKIHSVCPTEAEATRLTGKRIDNVGQGHRGMCIAQILDTRGVRSSQ